LKAKKHSNIKRIEGNLACQVKNAYLGKKDGDREGTKCEPEGIYANEHLIGMA